MTTASEDQLQIFVWRTRRVVGVEMNNQQISTALWIVDPALSIYQHLNSTINLTAPQPEQSKVT